MSGGESDVLFREFIDLIARSGVKVTFDPGRSHRNPCTFCGVAPASGIHELVTLGTYLNGEELTRPVCVACLPMVPSKPSP